MTSVSPSCGGNPFTNYERLTAMTSLASSSPPEPDWVALLRALRTFYSDRTSPGARDEAFGHVYQALRYLARSVVRRKLHSSQGSVSDVSEIMVDKVFLKKSFTDIALSFDPDHTASFKTWATTVLTNKFNDWCRGQKGLPDHVIITGNDWDELKNEWEIAVKDIAACDLDGEPRPDVLGELVAKEDLKEKRLRDAALRRARNSLSSELRDVFLVDETKETQREAARRLGISLATYKRRIKLVLASLKEALK